MKANKTIYLAEAAAPESGKGRKADILAKLAAAVAFGFIGFYLTFAIFGI